MPITDCFLLLVSCCCRFFKKNSIVVALTIYPDQDNQNNGKDSILKRPIPALLTNHGYCIPDPNEPNRLTIWFTGGSLECQNDNDDLLEWKQLFYNNKNQSYRTITEYAKILAAKFLLGATIHDTIHDETDNIMSYHLKYPIGGHGRVFIDVLYADDTIRIVKGHNDSIFVFNRVPDSELI